mmetsp:Transcript_63632/g.186688  ORF Transcript_63632/g.186688 Transcript_63632/m.186688 type:complete len:227 (+) Transcript_63632:1955-2635(+)
MDGVARMSAQASHEGAHEALEAQRRRRRLIRRPWLRAAAGRGEQELRGPHVVELHDGVPTVHGDVGDLSELLEAAHEGLGREGLHVHGDDPCVVRRRRERLRPRAKVEDEALRAAHVEERHQDAPENRPEANVQTSDVAELGQLLHGLLVEVQPIPRLGDAHRVGKVRRRAALGPGQHRHAISHVAAHVARERGETERVQVGAVHLKWPSGGLGRRGNINNSVPTT